ncbi:MAG: family ATPase [Acidobacteriota bacterium]|nr:family ATPase [Acidobacteriota bacterium]
MKEKNKPYRHDVAFINRNKEMADLKFFIDKRPAEILFIYGLKSSDGLDTGIQRICLSPPVRPAVMAITK